MIYQSISFGFTGNYFILALLLAIMIIAAILFYRFTLPPIPRRLRLLLTIVRSVVLVLLLMIIFEPLLRLINKFEQKPAIAVLVDASQSMTIKDGAGDRSVQVSAFVKNNNLRTKLTDVEPQFYTFSSKLSGTVTEHFDSISFNGETTDLSNALSELKDQYIKNNIQAVVLISDGNYNTGKNPIYPAEALSIPVYTVGVGDTIEQKDVLIKKVITNTLAYTETRIPVNVTVKSSGYKDENVEVILSENANIIDRKVVKLIEGTNEYQVQLFAEPKEEGAKKYDISVSKMPGELTERNNSKTIFVKILRSKLRILIMAGSPSSDMSSIRKTLEEDEHFTVSSFVQKSSNEFYEGKFNRSLVDSSDCILFIGFPSSVTGYEVVEQVREVIEQRKIPLLFINSKTTDYIKLQRFHSLLPFSWSNTNFNEILIFPSIPERMKLHPLILLNGNDAPDGWHALPPIYKMQTIFTAKPESDVLALAKHKNIILNEPLILTRNISRQKSFAILGHGVWRWLLLAQGNSQTEKLFSHLLSNAVRWLTAKEEDSNVRVTTVKEIFTTAEPIEFTGQVYNEQHEPVEDAELIVDLIHNEDKFQIALNPIGSGQYEGSIERLNEGDYYYSAKASTNGSLHGEAKGRFTVGQISVEFFETKLNKSLLEQIAHRTGGKYYDIDNSGNISDDIEKEITFSSKEIVQSSEIELWNWKYLAGIIILFLSFEWFLRKRSGML